MSDRVSKDLVNPPGCPHCARNETGLFTIRSASPYSVWRCEKCENEWADPTPEEGSCLECSYELPEDMLIGGLCPDCSAQLRGPGP